MSAQKYTAAKRAANKKWDAANLDRISVTVPRGTRAKWKEAAAAAGKSLNRYIADAVERERTMDKEKEERTKQNGTDLIDS